MWPKRELHELRDAYTALPGSAHEKARFQAVLLRCRIERVVIGLPPTIVRPSSSARHVRRRLLATVGEPGLSRARQNERAVTVGAAASVYEALCDLLHGRTTGIYPCTHDLVAWNRQVEELERELPARPAAE
jgi:hypothetical protein